MLKDQPHLQGYKAFEEYTKDLKESIIFYFSGSKNTETGVSWCSDCVKAEPIVDKVFSRLKSKPKLVYVEVGDRATFKDRNCPFRLNKNANVQVIPTLIRWKTPQRLEGEQCEKEDLLEMFFNEADE